MTDLQVSSLDLFIIPQIIGYILENSNISEIQAIEAFYKSKLYAELIKSSTGLWHYSPRLLYTLYQDELLTGSFEYPQV